MYLQIKLASTVTAFASHFNQTGYFKIYNIKNDTYNTVFHFWYGSRALVLNGNLRNYVGTFG